MPTSMANPRSKHSQCERIDVTQYESAINRGLDAS